RVLNLCGWERKQECPLEQPLPLRLLVQACARANEYVAAEELIDQEVSRKLPGVIIRNRSERRARGMSKYEAVVVLDEGRGPDRPKSDAGHVGAHVGDKKRIPMFSHELVGEICGTGVVMPVLERSQHRARDQRRRLEVQKNIHDLQRSQHPFGAVALASL